MVAIDEAASHVSGNPQATEMVHLLGYDVTLCMCTNSVLFCRPDKRHKWWVHRIYTCEILYLDKCMPKGGTTTSPVLDYEIQIAIQIARHVVMSYLPSAVSV